MARPQGRLDAGCNLGTWYEIANHLNRSQRHRLAVVAAHEIWSNYWVIYLDPGYQLVALSEPSREYLWILSRTPTVGRGREKGF